MLEYLGIFGIGAVVAVLVQSILNIYVNKVERSFLERKEAYIGLLQAYHEAAVRPCPMNSKNFAYWQMRCELVANKKVIMAIQSIIDTNEDINGRQMAHKNLKKALRDDLNIAT